MIGSKKFQLSEGANKLYNAISKTIQDQKYKHIVNPCGEISLNMKGGYCVLGNVVPLFCDGLEDVKYIII